MKSHFNPFLEEELELRKQESFFVFPSNEEYSTNSLQTIIMPEEQIFNSLRNISSEKNSNGQDYFQVIQELLILAKIDKLVLQLSDWCSYENTSSSINIKKRR